MQSNSSPVVVLVEPNILVKSRIKNILANQHATIYEAMDREDLMTVLSTNNFNVDLIVTEVEIEAGGSFDGISLIQLVKSKSSAIPVVVLTSISRKDVITRCLTEGAADYILKPFEDEYLKDKLLKYINLQNLTELTTLKFNLMNFLEGEIYKAKKGKYNFSLIKIDFDSKYGDKEVPPHEAFYKYAENVYEELKSLFWEADLYIRHGFQSHLGFFPFCDQANTQVILKKISSKFISYKSVEPGLDNYLISHVHATYPADGSTASELLKKLTSNHDAADKRAASSIGKREDGK